MTALASLLRIAVIALVVTACATPSKPTPGMADPYRGLRGKYPELYNLVGIGEAKLTGNAQRDRQGAEILAKAKIAEQIRVTVKAQILDIVRQEISKDIKETGEFTQITESHTNEMLEGVKIVEHGEDQSRGVVYAVAVLPREEAIARLTTRATLAYGQATTLIKRAEEAKRAGDGAGVQRFLIEARQVVLNGMALEGERVVIAGGLKDLPGTIPAISSRPDLAAIEAALPPGAAAPAPPAPSVAPPAVAPPTAPPVPAEPILVEATGEAVFGPDDTLAKVMIKALDQARRNAVAKAVGEFVRGSTIVYNYQVAEDLVNSIVRGVIEPGTEEILKEWDEDVKESGGGGRIKSKIHYTTIKAKVRPVPVERHGDYRLIATLNRTVFTNGDEAMVTLKTNQKSFLYIFSITQDDEVYALLPNKLIQDNDVEAGAEYVFPPEAMRTRGIKLRVSTPPGQTRSQEKIKVLASKNKLVFMGKVKFKEAVSLFSDFKGKDTGLMNDLLKELAQLDGADWTEATLPYEVQQ